MDNKDKKEVLKWIPAALGEAPKVIIPITVSCACAGIIVGIITMTGLGLRISSIIILFMFQMYNNKMYNNR